MMPLRRCVDFLTALGPRPTNFQVQKPPSRYIIVRRWLYFRLERGKASRAPEVNLEPVTVIVSASEVQGLAEFSAFPPL